MMPYPNYHHCVQMALAEKEYGDGGIHLYHNSENWSLSVISWGEAISVPVHFCPFCGKELPK